MEREIWVCWLVIHAYSHPSHIGWGSGMSLCTSAQCATLTQNNHWILLPQSHTWCKRSSSSYESPSIFCDVNLLSPFGLFETHQLYTIRKLLGIFPKWNWQPWYFSIQWNVLWAWLFVGHQSCFWPCVVFKLQTYNFPKSLVFQVPTHVISLPSSLLLSCYVHLTVERLFYHSPLVVQHKSLGFHWWKVPSVALSSA